MCLNKKFIYNKYIHRSVLVPCGHCPACMQEKANKRRLRLLNHTPSGYDVLFFHLTYSAAFLPYIYIDELTLDDRQLVHVYRDMDCKVTWNTKYNCHCYDYVYNPDKVIKEIEINNVRPHELHKLHQVDDFGRIGVLCYEDVQKFFKRLRSRLNNISYVKKVLDKNPLYYFVTGEYGETYQRPHWHILLYVPSLPKDYGYEFLKRTVVSAWPYGYDYITEKRFEYAIAPQTYVSRYVNCSSEISPLLQRGKIRPTWHYSKGFGRFNPAFQLDNILEKIRKLDFTYVQSYPLKNGFIRNIAHSFPSYITNRFFPQFKGLCRLSYDAVRCLLYASLSKDGVISSSVRNMLNYDDVLDYKKTMKQIKLSFSHYCHDSPKLGIGDYVHDFIMFLRAKGRFLLCKQLLSQTEKDILQSYDNVMLVVNCKPMLFTNFFGKLNIFSEYIVDPNFFDINHHRHVQLEDTYYKYVKKKKLNSVTL